MVTVGVTVGINQGKYNVYQSTTKKQANTLHVNVIKRELVKWQVVFPGKYKLGSKKNLGGPESMKTGCPAYNFDWKS